MYIFPIEHGEFFNLILVFRGALLQRTLSGFRDCFFLFFLPFTAGDDSIWRAFFSWQDVCFSKMNVFFLGAGWTKQLNLNIIYITNSNNKCVVCFFTNMLHKLDMVLYRLFPRGFVSPKFVFPGLGLYNCKLQIWIVIPQHQVIPRWVMGI